MKSGTTAGRKPGTEADAPRDEKPSDVSDGVAIRAEFDDGEPRRLRFVPLHDGRVTLVAEEWTGDGWELIKRDTANDVTIETEYGDVDLFTLTSYAGPYLEVEVAYQETEHEADVDGGEDA